MSRASASFRFRALAVGLAIAEVSGFVGCGLSLDGVGDGLGSDASDASLLDSPFTTTADGSTGVSEDSGATFDAGRDSSVVGRDSSSGDSSTANDSSSLLDAPKDSIALLPDANPIDATDDVTRPAMDSGMDSGTDSSIVIPSCPGVDAGLNGALALSSFTLRGNAAYDENNDGRITLTNSQNSQVGTAWYPMNLGTLTGYDLTWTLRVGPNQTAGDGITFAVLTAPSAPGVGEDGDGIGLQGITLTAGDSGVLAGYAVDVDMYQNTSDPTDLGPTTLKIVTMPDFTVVASMGLSSALNDGNYYDVDVSWRAPSTLIATLHGPGGGVAVVSSDNAGITAVAPYFGFTGATGGGSNSHNEIEGITITNTCE